jgi:hypothetical protein
MSINSLGSFWTIACVMFGWSRPFSGSARMLTVAVDVVGNRFASSAKDPVLTSLHQTVSTNVNHLALLFLMSGMLALLMVRERWLVSCMSTSLNMYAFELYVPKSCSAKFACVQDNDACSWNWFANKSTLSSHDDARLLQIRCTVTLWMVFLICVLSVYGASMGWWWRWYSSRFFLKPGFVDTNS